MAYCLRFSSTLSKSYQALLILWVFKLPASNIHALGTLFWRKNANQFDEFNLKLQHFKNKLSSFIHSMMIGTSSIQIQGCSINWHFQWISLLANTPLMNWMTSSIIIEMWSFFKKFPPFFSFPFSNVEGWFAVPVGNNKPIKNFAPEWCTKQKGKEAVNHCDSSVFLFYGKSWSIKIHL